MTTPPTSSMRPVDPVQKTADLHERQQASPATSNRARRTTTRASIVACCDKTPARTRPRAKIGVVILVVVDGSAGFVRS